MKCMENKKTAMQLVDFSNPNADKIKSASTAKPMKNKQTAVEWLMENLHTAKDPFKQAKEMEKEQIINAYSYNGWNDEDERADAEQYYNETYGKEG